MDILHSLLGLTSQWWFWLVLAASLMFASGNYIDELLLDEFEQPIGVLVIISGLFGLVLMSTFATMSLFMESQTIHMPFADIAGGILVGLLEMSWLIPYLYATERRGALVAGPLFQGVPVIAFVLEACGGNIPPMLQIVGALSIVIGGIILSIEEEENEYGEIDRSIDWITVGLMSLSVFLVAIIYVLFRGVAESSNYVGVGFWSGLGMLMATIIIFIGWKPYREEFQGFLKRMNGKAIGIQFFNECLDAGGAYLNHLANLLGPSVMVVSAFNAAQPIFIGLIAVFLYRNQQQATSWGKMLSITISIVLIAAGTIFIAIGEK